MVLMNTDMLKQNCVVLSASAIYFKFMINKTAKTFLEPSFLGKIMEFLLING